MERLTERLEAEPFVQYVYVPSDHPVYTSLLDRELRKAGLQDRDISILVPERFEDGSARTLGYVTGNKSDGYSIIVTRPDMKKRVIPWGVAYIKFGDCDRQLPKIIDGLYRTFITEPRALIYAMFRNIQDQITGDQ